MARKKKISSQDELELDQAYVELTGYKINSSRKKGGIGPFLIGLCILVLILGSCSFGLPYLLEQAHTPTDPSPAPTAQTTVPTEGSTAPETTTGGISLGQVADGVLVGGMEFGGMDAQEAAQALASLADAYAQNSMVITIAGTEHLLTPADTGIALDVSAALSAILAFDGDVFDLLPYLNLDTAAIEASLSALADQPVTPASYTVTGDMPALENGENVQCQTLVITLGTPGVSLDREQLYRQVLDAYNAGVFQIEAEAAMTEPDAIDLSALYDQYAIGAVDAVMDPNTFVVTGGSWGYDFDLDAAQTLLNQASYGETVEIPFRTTAPAVTADSLNALLYRDVLASYSSSHDSNYNRNNNLRLACEAINGMVLLPGDVFSYNQVLGERTTERGYLPAGSFVAGGVEETVGGGICQVSSNLYYCTLVAELEIVEHYNHGYTVGYVPLGMDATVSWGSLDFKFRNNTNYPLRIDAYVADGYVTIELVGTDEKDYYIELEYEIIAEYPYETVYREMTADNAEGYKDGDIITTGSTGYDVYTYQCKYSKETGELIERQWADISDYWKRDLVIVRITE